MLSIKGFSPGANKIMNTALKTAEELGHIYVGAEHLICAVCITPGLVTRGIYLKNASGGANPVGALRDLVGCGEPTKLSIADFNEGIINIMERALLYCLGMKITLVQPEHLMNAAADSKNRAVADFLKKAGIDPLGVRRDCADILPAAEEAGPKASKSQQKEQPAVRNLEKYGTDLTKQAAEGLLDPVVGRDAEIDRVIAVLARRRKNNPCLVGEPGVGKTAIAEGLAQRIAEGNVPEPLLGKQLVMLDLTGLVAGTKYRGDFESRLKATIDEITKSRSTIVFIDEIHTLIGTGSAEGAVDAANILKPPLARGELQLLGATTKGEYAKHIEKDAALERRLVPVNVDEPSSEAARSIVETLRPFYEQHHGVNITDEAIESAVALSQRYINERRLPDKAIDLIDEACSRAAFQQKQQIGPAEIERAVALWTGIPVESLTRGETEVLQKLEQSLEKRVVGQGAALKTLARALRRARTGLKDPGRPAGCFLFCGPSGVGKTELCRALASEVFGEPRALIRIDMSELSEQNAVSKLIGSPPGYAGYGEGGRLTEKVRARPYSVVLFDEAEKASAEVCALLLQIMEEGSLTDSEGREVDFKNCLVVLTTNVGAKLLSKKTAPLGFTTEGHRDSVKKSMVIAELEQVFSQELLGRIDEVVLFSPLKKRDLCDIAAMELNRLAARAGEAGVELMYDPEAPAYIVEQLGAERSARAVNRAVREQVADRLCDLLVGGSVARGGCVWVSVDGDLGLTVAQGRVVDAVESPL